MKRIVYALALLLCFGGSALADEAPKLIGSHGSWKVYSFLDNNQKVCFMSSQPVKQQGKFRKRGEVFFFVTHWSDDKDKNVVSISNGYSFKLDSQATLKAGDKTFKLFTQGEMAWTKDQSMDDAVTDALQKASGLVVKGTSLRGTEITDTYSLKGSGEAYQSLATECAKK